MDDGFGHVQCGWVRGRVGAGHLRTTEATSGNFSITASCRTAIRVFSERAMLDRQWA
jgi:hypothetical protein